MQVLRSAVMADANLRQRFDTLVGTELHLDERLTMAGGQVQQRRLHDSCHPVLKVCLTVRHAKPSPLSLADEAAQQLAEVLGTEPHEHQLLE